MTTEEIEKKIKELELNKERFVAEANRQIGQFDGAILVYRELLSSLTEKKCQT